MVAAGNGRVLVALKLEDEYEDGCFLFDLADRSCTREHWFQPAWVRQQWAVLQMGPEKGIRGLSAMNYGDRVLAAIATRAGFAACWELGSDRGCTIETETSVQSVDLHPHADLLAIGTGRRVLDLKSQAIAEVQIWSPDGEEMVERRRLPGACVINMLWVHHDDELVSGYRLRMVNGRPPRP